MKYFFFAMDLEPVTTLAFNLWKGIGKYFTKCLMVNSSISNLSFIQVYYLYIHSLFLEAEQPDWEFSVERVTKFYNSHH